MGAAAAAAGGLEAVAVASWSAQPQAPAPRGEREGPEGGSGEGRRREGGKGGKREGPEGGREGVGWISINLFWISINHKFWIFISRFGYT